jgi:isocitrate/isopropylmalate dehydrogenase
VAIKIGWLPGDGIGGEVLEAVKIVLDAAHLDANYVHGDIGWESNNILSQTRIKLGFLRNCLDAKM